MAAIIAFGISCIALIAFTAFKVYETSHTLEWYVRIRQKGDRIVIRWIGKAQRYSSHLEHYVSPKNVLKASVHTSASVVAKTARKIERHAHQVTRAMTHSARRPVVETKSSFLQEVSSHKKNLDTERIKRETSLTSEKEVMPE